ncbi:hypothetical protein ACQP3F_07890 [Escherichia coli]
MRRSRVLSGLQIPAPSVGRIRRLRRIRQQCRLPDATLTASYQASLSSV